jgi:peptidoglycan/xylan/chitin deacetylase (PgdA/CDA1 family)
MSSAAILMYHAIDAPRFDSERRFCVPGKVFHRQIEALKADGWTFLPLGQTVSSLRSGCGLPPKAISLTIDDGFACAHEQALPTLAELNVPATLFVVADRLGANNDWDSSKEGKGRRIVTRRELQELSDAGIDIGSHTLTHPRLTTISQDQLRSEVRDSKTRLEDITGRPVTHFAYPYGEFDAAACEEVAAAGYLSACSTIPGKVNKDTNLYLLRRIEVMGWDSLCKLRLKLRLGINELMPATRSWIKRTLAPTGLVELKSWDLR